MPAARLQICISANLLHGEKILPETLFEWQDTIEYAASIALSLIVGHALARALAATLRRKAGKI